MFSGNYANGHVKVYFAQGDNYEGDVIQGVMTGKGSLQCTNGDCFMGEFKEGKLHGDGKFFVMNGTYSTAGNYTEGVPEYSANKYLFKLDSPTEEKEDPKDKKDAKKPPVAVEEEKADGKGKANAIKITIDMINPDESKKIVSFSLRIVH
jgi:hypothetical protein